MQQILPEQLDFVQATRKASQIDGFWPIHRLDRISELVLVDDGDIEAELEFELEDGLRTVSGLIKASLEVTCQRCMQPMTLHLETEFSLALVSDESRAELLPERFEPLILDEDNRLNIPVMLEEEILLAMPLVPLHDNDCSDYLSQQKERQASEQEQSLEKDNPFSVLKDLL